MYLLLPLEFKAVYTMSSTILELMRLNHEMMENAEKEICDELDNYPSGVSSILVILTLRILFFVSFNYVIK